MGLVDLSTQGSHCSPQLSRPGLAKVDVPCITDYRAKYSCLNGVSANDKLALLSH